MMPTESNALQLARPKSEKYLVVPDANTDGCADCPIEGETEVRGPSPRSLFFDVFIKRIIVFLTFVASRACAWWLIVLSLLSPS